MRWLSVSAALVLVACNVKVKVHVDPVAGTLPDRCYERGSTISWNALKDAPVGASEMRQFADRFAADTNLNDHWLRVRTGK
jgi:hypothetical protein